MAALGREVVPDVNCTLIVSSGRSGESDTIGLQSSKANRLSNGIAARMLDVSIRDEEFSTKMIFRREGMDADSNFEASKSGEICLKRVTFSLGFLYGRFVSAPIIRCAASRCDNAAMI